MKKLVLCLLLLSSPVFAANPFHSAKGSLATVGEGVTVTANSSDEFNTVTLQLAGTWAGTVEVFGTLDGSNYTQLVLAPVGTGVGATSFTANGLYSGPTGGVRIVVARFTSDTSGTVTVRLAMSKSSGSSATGGAGGISVASSPWPGATGDGTAYTLTSATVRSINVTTVAGTSGNCEVCLAVYDGTGAGLSWAKTNSATPPTCMDGINDPCGGYIGLIAGLQCRAAKAGDYFHTISHSVGDVEVWEEVGLVD